MMTTVIGLTKEEAVETALKLADKAKINPTHGNSDRNMLKNFPSIEFDIEGMGKYYIVSSKQALTTFADRLRRFKDTSPRKPKNTSPTPKPRKPKKPAAKNYAKLFMNTMLGEYKNSYFNGQHKLQATEFVVKTSADGDIFSWGSGCFQVLNPDVKTKSGVDLVTIDPDHEKFPMFMETILGVCENANTPVKIAEISYVKFDEMSMNVQPSATLQEISSAICSVKRVAKYSAPIIKFSTETGDVVKVDALYWAAVKFLFPNSVETVSEKKNAIVFKTSADADFALAFVMVIRDDTRPSSGGADETEEKLVEREHSEENIDELEEV